MKTAYHNRGDTIGPHQGYRDDAPAAGSGECLVTGMTDEDYERHVALLNRKRRIRRGAVHDQVVDEAVAPETPQNLFDIWKERPDK